MKMYAKPNLFAFLCIVFIDLSPLLFVVFCAVSVLLKSDKKDFRKVDLSIEGKIMRITDKN